MKKIYSTMRKILFIALAVLSISCQTNTNETKKASQKIEVSTKLWQTDINKALQMSAESGKPIFAFFTGKEWCSWCKKLDRQVLSQEAFKSYAKENLILLELDFPRGKRNLPAKQIELARKFNIQGYPTVILMDAKTNHIATTGYEAMSPVQYVNHLKSLLSK